MKKPASLGISVKRWLERWLLNVWYGDDWLGKYCLLPLTGVYCFLAGLHAWKQKRQQEKHPVPVVVVGNMTAGGTGKTPLVVWLVEKLRESGFEPGVVSRGFGSAGYAGVVFPDDDPAVVGDEPLLIARRTQVPLSVGRDRNGAIKRLLKQYACDIIIADDGLQHYRMARDVEICVIDAYRGFGNGWCLPAGPLREQQGRVSQCDFTVVNGDSMRLHGDVLYGLSAKQQPVSLTEFAGKTAHAVTGIGNPTRFFTTLEAAGLSLIKHAYPDHHAFDGSEIRFNDDLPVIITEKDAVKCRQYAATGLWYLPVCAELDAGLAASLMTRLQGLCNGQKTVGNHGMPCDQRPADLQ